jgi:hypothetical protein
MSIQGTNSSPIQGYSLIASSASSSGGGGGPSGDNLIRQTTLFLTTNKPLDGINGTDVPWDELSEIGVSGTWDALNPTKIIPPVGATHAKVTFQARIALSTAGARYIDVTLFDNTDTSIFRFAAETAASASYGNPTMNASSGWKSINATDYIVARAQSSITAQSIIAEATGPVKISFLTVEWFIPVT